MTRRHSRTAGLTAVVACMGLLAPLAGCLAPGAGYATMRFALERQAPSGSKANAVAAARQPAAGPGSAPLAITAEVATRAPSGVAPARASGGGTGGSGPAAPRAIEVNHPAAGPGKVWVSFNLGDLVPGAVQRRLLATVADIDYVVVTITPASGPEVSQSVLASSLSGGAGTVAFAGLPPGPATATIRAYDAIGNPIGSGTQPIVVDAVVPTTVTFTVTLDPTYLPPTGSVNTDVTFVDGPVIVGTPPPGTDFASGAKVAESKEVITPEGITFDPAGTAWFPAFTADRVVGLDRALLPKASHRLEVPGADSLLPADIAFDDAGWMWVANYAAGSISQVDPLSGAIVLTIPVGPNPTDIEFFNGILYVLLYPADVIMSFTTGGFPAGPPIVVNLPPLPVPGKPIAKPPYHLPVTMKISPAGDIWVANLKSDTVSRISPAGTFEASIPVGDEPEGVAFGADGSVWVTNNRGGTVSKIDPATNSVVGTYTVGKRPRGLALDKLGNLWIACSEGNEVVRMSPTGVVRGRYPTGRDPRHVAVDAAGAIWVACHEASLVQKFAP